MHNTILSQQISLDDLGVVHVDIAALNLDGQRLTIDGRQLLTILQASAETNTFDDVVC